jgi:zinc protease
VSRAELETGRAALTRGFARNFETAEQVARAAAQMALHDLPNDYYSSFVPRMLAMNETDVTAAAHRHLHPDQMLTVVVGDRDKVGASLDSLGLGNAMVLET